MQAQKAPDERVVVLTPSADDATVVTSALTAGAVPHVLCADLDALCAALIEGAGATVIASEALTGEAFDRVHDVLEVQPSWSDLPLIVITPPAATLERDRRTFEVLSRLGNMTTIERPLHALGVIAAARAALRARSRQYETRDLLRQLEETIRQRERFLAILGHELRNPLGAIRNAVQLAGRHPARDGVLGRALELIQRQSRILDRLVDDLLDVSRVTSGKIVLQREKVDLGAIAQQALEQVEPLLLAQRIDSEVQPSAEPLVVDADPARIEQILTNLLANAAKYTPENGRVTLRLRREDATAVVSVTDTGYGIAKELLPRIFDLFAQGDVSLDRARGGLGIGLTLSRSLAELHGGSLRATSDGPGLGSTFTLRLPLVPPLIVAPPTRSEAPVARKGRTVLVVEDSPDNRESLRELLEWFGHRVYVAADGVEGLEVAVEVRPEVAIIDVGLPRVNGYEVARNIRAELGDAIRLVALTGYGLPEDRERSREAGFDAHVTKPVDIDDLERLIARPDLATFQGTETR